jgi:hypothetical protein
VSIFSFERLDLLLQASIGGIVLFFLPSHEIDSGQYQSHLKNPNPFSEPQ